jgi:hypothetical protein
LFITSTGSRQKVGECPAYDTLARTDGSVDHINMLGRYAFTLPETVARGELRPLRDPRTVRDDDG